MDGYNAKEIYSTSEIKTNKVWIDGKPIYRRCLKVLSSTNISNGATISGVSDVFVSDITPTLSTLISYNILGSGDSSLMATFNTSNGVFGSRLTDGSHYVSHYTIPANSYIYFEYTKTTD